MRLPSLLLEDHPRCHSFSARRLRSPSPAAIITTIVIDLIVYIVTILVFSGLRISKWSRKFIQPRSHDPRNVNKPHELPSTFFGWIMPIINYKEPDVGRGSSPLCGAAPQRPGS